MFVNLFAPFSIDISQNGNPIVATKVEAADCKFVSATLDPHSGQGKYIASITGQIVKLNITTSNCQGQLISGTFYERDPIIAGGNSDLLDFPAQKITSDTFTLSFKAGEAHCEGGECEIIYRLFLTHGDGSPGNWDVYNSTDPDELDFKCQSDTCNTNIDWVQATATGVAQTIQFTRSVTNTQTSITVSGNGPQAADVRTDDTVTIALYNRTTNDLVDPNSAGGKNPIVYNVVNDLSKDGGKTISYSATFSGLAKGALYTLTITPNFSSDSLQSLNKVISLPVSTLDSSGQQVEALPTTGATDTLGQAQSGDGLPVCWTGLTSGGISIPGCLAQGIYYLLFIPTSFLFALTGKFFDWTFAYSVNDNSYRTPFVVQGWGIVRDFCNLFFIFVLLYIAFRTILGLSGGHGGPNTKSMVINVVIIGLLINFSLFTTQIIIDTSNILARVFYNSDAIKISQGNNTANGVTDATSTLGPNGEIQLSAAIVNKVNPQNLIINSKKVGVINDAGGKVADGNENLGTGTFILVTILAVAVNIVGLIVFLSVGLIFITRVIGLWFSMIFVPFAFFSYTVPGLNEFDTIGWKKWWPETLKMAFLAPIFIFFLYLILKFLNTGLDLISANNRTGIDFVISTTVPFIFIMVLLLKARSLASSMSGKLGQSITGGIAAAGSLALGGAALGTAALGRQTVGKGMARTSQGNTATQKYESGTARGLAKYTGWAGSKLGLGKVFGRLNPQTGVVSGGIGGVLNKKQAHVEHIDHDRHDIDAVKDKRYKGVDINKLSGTQVNNVKADYVKDNKAKFAATEEEAYRSQNNIRGNRPLNATERADVNKNIVTAAEKEFEDKLKSAKKAVSGFDRALTRSNTGTYDVRNLSQTKVDKRDGFFTNAQAKLIAGIAMGVRTGLKSININHGSGQNDFFKDIGNTLTEALKSTTLKVKIEESHGTGGGDAHAGGGHH
jgi:hypothetical protein